MLCSYKQKRHDWWAQIELKMEGAHHLVDNCYCARSPWTKLHWGRGMTNSQWSKSVESLPKLVLGSNFLGIEGSYGWSTNKTITTVHNSVRKFFSPKTWCRTLLRMLMYLRLRGGRRGRGGSVSSGQLDFRWPSRWHILQMIAGPWKCNDIHVTMNENELWSRG